MSTRRVLVCDAPQGCRVGLSFPCPGLPACHPRPFSPLFCSLSDNGKSSDHFKSPKKFSFSYPNRPVLCNSQNWHLPAAGGFSPRLAGTRGGLPAAVGRGGEPGLSLPLCHFLLSPTPHPELRALILQNWRQGKDEKRRRGTRRAPS